MIWEQYEPRKLQKLSENKRKISNSNQYPSLVRHCKILILIYFIKQNFNMNQRCFQGDSDSGDAGELITEEQRE